VYTQTLARKHEGIFMEALANRPLIAEELSEYRLVDSIPEVATERQAVREHAERILAANRARVEADRSLNLVPVDALSTGRAVLEAEQTYGAGSPEHKERWNGLVLDCGRLVGEWYRKLKPEHFKPVRHTYVGEEQDFYSHGLSTRQMTENALVPIAEDSEEEQRRVNEHVEDRTPQILRGLGAIAVDREVIRTVSECTDSAITSYQSDMANGRKHRGYRGYVPEIEKLMVRDILLDTKTSDRFEEVVGLPGVYFTHDIIQLALKRRNMDVSGMGKTELHGAQFIAPDDLMEFVALLDEVASEQWCTNIFMGEEVELGFDKNYAAFRQEALARQESLQELAETTATFVLDVADSDIDTRNAPAHVEEFVKMQLLNLGKTDHNAAMQMFDEKTADGLQEVARLEAAGELELAFLRMEQVNKEAPGGGACGAGSCGLEAVNLSGEAGEDLKKKLRAEAGDTIVSDKERACKCGKKTIIYAYNSSKVNKYCKSCDRFESKTTTA